MLNDILRMICPAAGLTFVSFEDELFLRGVAKRSVDITVEFRERGYCYGGFRSVPYYPIPILDTCKAVFLVRDPRDILVSQYFSVAHSHIVPEPDGRAREEWISKRKRAQSTPIDNWVMANHGFYIRSMDFYLSQQFLSRANITVYRYEDIIFRKREWIADMADWFRWDLPGQLIEKTAEQVDIFPAESDPMKHIRQVSPGNYRTELKVETQEKLTLALGEFLTLFGYDDEQAHGARELR